MLEAVGVALLTSPSLGQDKVLAALLAYRALYYFVPLVLASLAWVQQNCAGATVQQLLPKIRGKSACSAYYTSAGSYQF